MANLKDPPYLNCVRSGVLRDSVFDESHSQNSLLNPPIIKKLPPGMKIPTG